MFSCFILSQSLQCEALVEIRNNLKLEKCNMTLNYNVRDIVSLLKPKRLLKNFDWGQDKLSFEIRFYYK